MGIKGGYKIVDFGMNPIKNSTGEVLSDLPLDERAIIKGIFNAITETRDKPIVVHNIDIDGYGILADEFISTSTTSATERVFEIQGRSLRITVYSDDAVVVQEI